MAVLTEDSPRKRKRRRLSNNPKLLVGDKVEVRRLEESYKGSWHIGTVIACEILARRVQYKHLLCDDGSESLTECVRVTSIVDGIGIASINRIRSNYRGLIRPYPPLLHFEKRCLHYGQCVDVYYKEAWWEGVIFDHEDGSEQRKIFFPDSGEVTKFGIEMLRITQDWDEFTEDWKPRGNWLFLEWIEEYEPEWPLQVSVRQMWYDIQGKKGFEKLKEWISSKSDIWKDLVLNGINDNFKLTLKEFFLKLDSPEDLVQESQQVLELSEPAVDVVLKPQADLINPHDVVVPYPLQDDGLLPTNPTNGSVPSEEDIDWGFMEDGGLDINLSMPRLEEMLCEKSLASSSLLLNADEFSGACFNTNSDEFSGNSSTMLSTNLNHSTQRKSHRWLPAGKDLVPEARFCPDAVTQYNSYSRKRAPGDLKLNVRKHLAFVGWKIEFTREKGIPRLRYTSPDGRCYLSLRKICQDLRDPAEILSRISQDNNERISSAAPDGPFSFPRTKKPRAKMEPPVMSSPPDVVVEPEYCPQAVMNYYSLTLEDENDHWSKRKDAKDLISKVKKHLSAVGWSFWYKWKKDRWELRYSSPKGRCYYSLRTACKGCIDEGEVLLDCGASTSRPEQTTSASANEDAEHLAGDKSSSALIGELKGNVLLQNALPENWATESSSLSPSRKLLELGEVKVQGFRELQKKERRNELGFASHLLHKEDQNASSRILKKGQESKKSSFKLRGDWDDDCSTLVQSSKRVRQAVVPSSSHHNPRSVLSWLIDNDVVLPGAKAHYRDKKDHRPMAEGWITRAGIKCSCCHTIFTLTKFEAHAGSTNHRPSANIFLEDGRSLLQCQLQLKLNNNTRSFIKDTHEMKGKRHHRANDHICSVCHLWGELVLCDQCPSSFHTSCLGLKDVPDGDWFCPYCYCGICGQSRFNQDTKQFMDNSGLICDQCEHQYHVGCVKKRDLMKLDSYPKGNWFCNKNCEQIFVSLRKLLGKPVPLGKDNLTWTLLKYMKHDRDDNASDFDASMENFNKLHVALDVMHECFEPVKEFRTRRDLVRDVIFSRWSELRRLNFRGFYTVILERDDELITAATLRVHGKKVAEVPVVGTRFQYRRLGMCRILMNELEKMLMDLGVERLVLPAVPSVLNTWTSSFGFSKMPESERLNFLDYPFLDFEGTIMCQKLLMKTPSAESTQLLEGTQQNFYVDVNGSDDIDFDRNSSFSEVFQADHNEETETVNQGQGQYDSPLISSILCNSNFHLQ